MTKEEKQKAIDALKISAPVMVVTQEKFNDYIQTLNKIMDWLEQEPRWIPVSERMPEEREWIGTKKFGTTISDEVYVTLETISGKRFCDHIRFQNGKFSLSKQAELDAISKGTKPIAWMKLPEPYQPKESEDKK